MSDQTVIETLKWMLKLEPELVDGIGPAFQDCSECHGSGEVVNTHIGGGDFILCNCRDIKIPNPKRIALTSALAALEARTWRDISTAPKDGTNVLVCRCAGSFQVPVVAQWSNRATESFNWNDGEYSFSPTHWMPLPVSPDAAERTETTK